MEINGLPLGNIDWEKVNSWLIKPEKNWQCYYQIRPCKGTWVEMEMQSLAKENVSEKSQNSLLF